MEEAKVDQIKDRPLKFQKTKELIAVDNHTDT